MCEFGCEACPFNFFSEKSQEVSNYGCLPDPIDVKEIYEKLDGVWGCHETSTKDGNLKPCVGFITWMARMGTPVKIKGKTIVDYDIWYKDPEYFNLKNLQDTN